MFPADFAIIDSVRSESPIAVEPRPLASRTTERFVFSDFGFAQPAFVFHAGNINVYTLPSRLKTCMADILEK